MACFLMRHVRGLSRSADSLLGAKMGLISAVSGHAVLGCPRVSRRACSPQVLMPEPSAWRGAARVITRLAIDAWPEI
jgi:hypothetical protein